MQDLCVNLVKGKKQDIPLTVERVEASVWRDLGFYQHHYLSAELNPSAKCFLFRWNGQPVAFYAILPALGFGGEHSMRGSRLVVHPDYQGLGFAHRVANFIGGVVRSLGPEANLYGKTIHAKVGAMRDNDPLWERTSSYGKCCVEDGGGNIKHMSRPSFCHKYVGPPIYGYEDLFAPIEALRYRKELLLMGPSLFGDDDW